MVLSSIASRGGREAGVFLRGLLANFREQPERLGTIVSALSSIATPATVEVLAGELFRVESTAATRTYLNDVLRQVTRLPRELWEPKLRDMARALTSARGGAGNSKTRWSSSELLDAG